jgi:hypothetical protein
MNDILRALVALLFAILLFWHSRTVASRPNQRRAYRLAAVAMLLVAALNAAGTQDMTRQLVVGGAAFVALLAAAVFLVRGYFAGEMRADHRRAAEMAREYRERREREIDESRKPKDT